MFVYTMQYGGIVKPFLEECQLTGDIERDSYEEYFGLDNVSAQYSRTYVHTCYVHHIAGIFGSA